MRRKYRSFDDLEDDRTREVLTRPPPRPGPAESESAIRKPEPEEPERHAAVVHDASQIKRHALTDTEELRRAYATDDNVYVSGDTLFVSGTKHVDTLAQDALLATTDGGKRLWDDIVHTGKAQDVYDDLKIPFFQTKHAQRYKEAQRTLDANPQIKNIVGHSLGAATVLELQKNNKHRNLNAVAYNAPIVSSPTEDAKTTRFRQYGDPISIFDRGAKSTVSTGSEWLNPHSYSATGSSRVTGQLGLLHDSTVQQEGLAGAGVEGATALVE